MTQMCIRDSLCRIWCDSYNGRGSGANGDAEAGSCAHYAADGTDFRIVETGSWPRIHRRGRRGSVRCV